MNPPARAKRSSSLGPGRMRLRYLRAVRRYTLPLQFHVQIYLGSRIQRPRRSLTEPFNNIQQIALYWFGSTVAYWCVSVSARGICIYIYSSENFRTAAVYTLYSWLSWKAIYMEYTWCYIWIFFARDLRCRRGDLEHYTSECFLQKCEKLSCTNFCTTDIPQNEKKNANKEVPYTQIEINSRALAATKEKSSLKSALHASGVNKKKKKSPDKKAGVGVLINSSRGLGGV